MLKSMFCSFLIFSSLNFSCVAMETDLVKDCEPGSHRINAMNSLDPVEDYEAVSPRKATRRCPSNGVINTGIKLFTGIATIIILGSLVKYAGRPSALLKANALDDLECDHEMQNQTLATYFNTTTDNTTANFLPDADEEPTSTCVNGVINIDPPTCKGKNKYESKLMKVQCKNNTWVKTKKGSSYKTSHR